MLNFTFHNPTKIVFGKGTISELANLLDEDLTVMVTYGGGSIKKNGVYEQVMDALDGFSVIEFGGIEPNPKYETLMKAVELGKKNSVGFLLAVGGGSVLDGTKFISAAIHYKLGDPWDILDKGAPVVSAVPLGSVMTLAATGSESNGFAVISRESTREKLHFASEQVWPKFAILDPQTTTSLPERQTKNGIVDAYVHVCEQYLTYDVNALLQDRQSEGILLTLIEIASDLLKNPEDYALRANLMWCATQALNGLIGCGVPQDWATHMIGHELTAMFGIDHAQSLAVVLPAVLEHQREKKAGKLLQYAKRVWSITEGTDDEIITKAVKQTKDFFTSIGMPVYLSDYSILPDSFEEVVSRLKADQMKLGENGNIGDKEVMEILNLCK